MSEYQFYEFLAVDRPLSKSQIAEVRGFSTRAKVSATGFVNEYQYGDFRGNPTTFLLKYFDLMVYCANWGTHQLMVSLPKGLFDVGVLAAFRTDAERGVTFDTTGEKLIVDFTSQEDGGDGPYGEGEGWMEKLDAIREELLTGDERSLYVGFLSSLYLEMDGLEKGPLMPAGMGSLTTAQLALARFMRVDEHILAAAGRLSGSREKAGPEVSLEAWLATVPQGERDGVLLKLLDGSDPTAGKALVRRWKEASAGTGGARGIEVSPAKVIELAREIEKEEAAGRKAAAERKRLKQQAERGKFLSGLVGRENEIWEEAESLVRTTVQANYEVATSKLCDLRDLAIQRGMLEAFKERISALRHRHRSKIALMRRMSKAKLDGY